MYICVYNVYIYICVMYMYICMYVYIYIYRIYYIYIYISSITLVTYSVQSHVGYVEAKAKAFLSGHMPWASTLTRPEPAQSFCMSTEMLNSGIPGGYPRNTVGYPLPTMSRLILDGLL